eukprot:6192267-Pyramimonas_sp.AAC.1
MKQFPPVGRNHDRRWLIELPHQSSIEVTEGTGGTERVISLKPLNARELANRLYSNSNLWSGEDYDELLRKTRYNETFVRSEAYKRMCAPSDGEA